jgi:hypothetical protein
MSRTWKSILTSVQGLFGNTRSEMVVAHALYGCHLSMKGRYTGFSLLGNGKARKAGVINDGKTYQRLLKEGFFIQAKAPARKIKKLPQGVHPDAEGYVGVVYVSRELVKKLVPFLRKQGKEIA